MRPPKPWWQLTRIKHRDAIALCVLSAALLLVSRIAYATLVFGTPMAYLIPLATSLTGVGLLAGAVAHTLMGQYALLAKKRMAVVWRRWRRARGPRRRGARRGRSARFG